MRLGHRAKEKELEDRFERLREEIEDLQKLVRQREARLAKAQDDLAAVRTRVGATKE